MIDKTTLKAQAAALGIELDGTALDRFDKYAEMLVETNKTMNLTAITEPSEIVSKHFADCLSLLKEVDIKKGAKMIDVGTGAGFPGVVILIARPDINMTLMDSTGKRLKFVQSVIDVLGLNAGRCAHESGRSRQKSRVQRKIRYIVRKGGRQHECAERILPPLFEVRRNFCGNERRKSLGRAPKCKACHSLARRLGFACERVFYRELRRENNTLRQKDFANSAKIS